MSDLLLTPYVVPLGAFAVAIAVTGFAAWRKVREAELSHDREMRLREMEHQIRLKQMDLDAAAGRAAQTEPQK